jgi:hypothetical protein
MTVALVIVTVTVTVTVALVNHVNHVSLANHATTDL